MTESCFGLVDCSVLTDGEHSHYHFSEYFYLINKESTSKEAKKISKKVRAPRGDDKGWVNDKRIEESLRDSVRCVLLNVFNYL